MRAGAQCAPALPDYPNILNRGNDRLVEKKQQSMKINL